MGYVTEKAMRISLQIHSFFFTYLLNIVEFAFNKTLA